MKQMSICSFVIAALLSAEIATAKDPIEAKLRPGGNYMDTLKAQTSRGSFSSSRSNSRYSPRYSVPNYSVPTAVVRRTPVYQSNNAVVRQSYSYPSQVVQAPYAGTSSVVVSQPCVPSVQTAPINTATPSVSSDRSRGQIHTSIQSGATQGVSN